MRKRTSTASHRPAAVLAGAAAAVCRRCPGDGEGADHGAGAGAEAVGANRGLRPGFDLKSAPPLAIERARTAFVDTVGVTLAGSTEKAAAIVRDMVQGEGAAPQ